MADFAWLFGSSSRSDVDLVLVEEEGDDDDEAAAAQGGSGGDDAGAASAAAAGAKRSRPGSGAGNQVEQQQQEKQVTLPAHAVVLMASSGFCKAKLENWAAAASGGACGDDDDTQQAQEQQPRAATNRRRRGKTAADDAAPPTSSSSSSSRPRVVLHVPRGQLSVGQRLVRAMYEAAPALGDLGADELVQLLLLADRYDAPRVVAAAAAAAGVDAVVVADEGGVDWALMHAGFKEPAASPPSAALLASADAALQRQLGDLELVWANAGGGQKRQRLLALPFGAVKALLASDETRVASENTAFHTVQRWLNAQQWGPAAYARAKELLGLLRPQHMTLHYARTVFCESEVAKAHLDSDGLKLACTLPSVDVSRLSFDPETISEHPSWLKPARPRSVLADEVMVEWRLPLAELKRCVEQQLAAGEGSLELDGPMGVVWQGWPLLLWLDCTLSAGGGLTLGVYLCAQQPCSAAVAVVMYVLGAAAAEDGSGVSWGAITRAFTKSFSFGYYDFFSLGEGDATPPRDWAGLEAALRGKGVVHGGSGGGTGGGVAAAHLQLRARVTRLE